MAVVVFQPTSDVPAVKDPPPLIAAKAAKPVLAGIPAPLLEKAIANCCAVVPNTPAVQVKPLKLRV
jgi:hypothetical protein